MGKIIPSYFKYIDSLTTLLYWLGLHCIVTNSITIQKNVVNCPCNYSFAETNTTNDLKKYFKNVKNVSLNSKVFNAVSKF